MNAQLVSSLDAVTRSRLVTVASDASVVDVAKLLAGTQVSLVVVCDRGGVMVGVVTKTNIVRQIGQCCGSSCSVAAEKIMSRSVIYCSPCDLLPDVLSKMEKGGFVHLPVVDQNLVPLGVVNARDALRALLADEKYEESLLRNYIMGIGYQ